MSSDPPDLGKGLFGYRKSAVNQIISDRDIMLRQAEGRVRAAESKVAEMEVELVSMRERNSRMDEQLDRLRQQLDILVGREPTILESGQHAHQQEPEPAAVEEQPAAAEAPYAEAPYAEYAEEEPSHAQPQWPDADASWPGIDESPSAAEAEVVEAEQPMTAAEDDDLPYGTEVRLRGAAAAETPEWMQTVPTPSDEEEEEGPDEVALASGGYGFEDYDADEQQGYGEFGSEEEEEEEEAKEEAPSPFSRFPFASETFDHEPAPVASSVEEEGYADEPVQDFRAAEPEAPEPEPASVQVEDRPAAAVDPSSMVSQETTDITNRFLTEELTAILAAAEESAGRIVERARATTQRQIGRSNKVWREVQAEVSRFAAWRQEVEPVIRSVQAKVEGVRSEIDEVPERIRQALAPMADAISSIDADLAELASASNPPLLLTPSDLESEGSDPDHWGLDDEEDEAFHGSSGDSFGDPFRDASDKGSGHLHAG